MSKKFRLLFLSLIFMGVVTFSVVPTVFTTTLWASPINITNNNRDDFQPTITADTLVDRASHVSWVGEMVEDNELTWEIFYANSTDWNTHIQITNNYVKDYNPMIDMDNSGVVHIVFVRELDQTSDIFYTNSTDWNRQINVSRQEKGQWNHWPTLVVEKSTGIPHIAWTIGEDSPAGDIWYRKGIWGSIEQVVNTSSKSFQPSIDLDSAMGVHVVWSEWAGSDFAIRYTNSSIWPATAAGGYLNVSDQIDNQDNDLRPDIAVDQLNNRSHVTWYKDLATPEVYWAVSILQNKFFLNPTRASNPDMKCMNPSVQVSTENNTIIIFEGFDQDWDIIAVDYNSSWTHLDISQNPYPDSLYLSSIGALDIDKYDTVYATYSANIGTTVPDLEILVVDGNVLGGGIPGFELAYIWMSFLSVALIWYLFRRKPL